MTENSVGVPIAFGIMLFLLLWLIIFTEGKWFLKFAAVAATLFFSVSLWHSIDSLLGLPSETQLPDKFLVHWIVIEEPNKITGDEGSIYIWAKDLGEDAIEPVRIVSRNDSPNASVRAHARTPRMLDAPNLADEQPRVASPPDNGSRAEDYMLELQEKDLETPRVHVVPYSRELHQQANRALGMLRKGQRVFGNGKDFANARSGKGKGKGKGKGRFGDGKRSKDKGNPGYSSVAQDPIFHELPPPKMPVK